MIAYAGGRKPARKKYETPKSLEFSIGLWVNMKVIFGLMMTAWAAFLQVQGRQTDVLAVACLLGALCFFIVKEKYFDKIALSVAYFAAAAVLAQYRASFMLLAAIPLLDFVFLRRFWLAGPAFAVAVYFSVSGGYAYFILLFAVSAFTGYVLGEKKRNEQAGIEALDEERRLRYNLELAQSELLQSRREIERLTEARERNRIAHELHDSIGHGIAGVLIQLEAALRIHRRDADKTEEILKTCTGKLSDTLTLTRNALYNIRSGIKTGLEALEDKLAGFTFCPVDFQHTGDFTRLSATNMEILEACVTETLTNAARYSGASRIIIRIDIRTRNVRFYYKDDGLGCSQIQEGMGLAGMRNRVRNAGGTFSADGSDGFMIVCNLPVQLEKEGGEET